MRDIFEFTKTLAPLMKERGFKKVRSTWHKEFAGTTMLFSLVKSKPDYTVKEYCFGTAINELCDRNIVSIKQCHITQTFYSRRYGQEWPIEELMNAVDYWESRYCNLKALCVAARKNKLPPNTSLNTIKHLKWTDMSKL